MKRPRMFLLLAASLAFSLTLTTSSDAESPERTPTYANARALREDASLRAVAFNNPGVSTHDSPTAASRAIGIACGDRGTILSSEDGGQTWTERESRVDCRLDDVIWIDRKRVVIVGGGYDRITRISRGVVLYSDDAGAHWQRSPDEELPRLKALRLRTDNSLIAEGDWSHSLLTRRFESHDHGRTWHGSGKLDPRPTIQHTPTSSELRKLSATTNASVPIRDACRVNESTLCAVGDHGVIMISADNGATWQGRRGEQRRSAILMVANRPTSVAWSLLGSEALENRCRVALLLHHLTDSESDGASTLDLANQVTVMLGGSGVDQIIPQRDGLTAQEPMSGGHDVSLAATNWIKIHRPATLVLDQSLPAHVHDAFFQAATASGVQRIVVYSFDGVGKVALHRNAFLTNTGVLASDLAADAMHLLASDRSSASSISLRYLYDLAAGTRQGESVVGGMPLDGGQVLDAPAKVASRRQLQIAQARLKQSERILNLIQSNSSPNQFSETLGLTLDQTAKEDQFRLSWSILQATNSAEAIVSDVAFQEASLDQLASRFPATSAGRWAQLRRETIRRSLEWKRLRSALASNAFQTVVARPAEIVPVSPFQTPQSGIQQVSAISPVVVPTPETHDLTKPTEESLQVDLTWEFHPLVLIAREAARRRTDDGGLQVAGGQTANLRRLADTHNNVWAELLRTDGPRVLVARRATSPPNLDGVIDDVCWSSALPSAGRTQHLRFAYDRDYVYVAITCPSDQLHPDSRVDGRSSTIRDDDLTDTDRMQLSIDIDRDLLTAMQLQVSDARRTHDAIDGLPRWSPTWYVASKRSDDQLSFEIAILRRDLVDLPIHAGESWYVSAKPIRAGSTPGSTVLPTPGDWMRVIFHN